jgi:hypothetical protein
MVYQSMMLFDFWLEMSYKEREVETMKPKSKNLSLSSEAPPLKLNNPEVTKLWIRAGGRCEFDGCNEYLLEDEFTGIPVRIADIAHVVGRGKNEGSPRGQDPLPIKDRNKSKNLMLLCPKHHRMIDKKELASQFTKDVLFKYKDVHENRIRHLTSLGPERETTVICMTGNIRENNVSISAEEIRKAVYESNGRYPRFFVDDNSIKIDLTKLPEKNLQLYWESGKQRIDHIVERQVFPAIESEEIKHLSIFALARIPFTIYLGYRLGDKIAADIYQKHRDGNEDWTWRKESETFQFKSNLLQEKGSDSNVALILSLSGRIEPKELPDHISNDFSIYEIMPEGTEPNRSLVTSENTLGAFRTVYQRLLREIEKSHKGIKELHLFPAIPVSVAVVCGRELLKDITPHLHVYDKIEDEYIFALEVK